MSDAIIAVCLAAYCVLLLGVLLWQERVRQREEDRHWETEAELRGRLAEKRRMLKDRGVDVP